MESQILGLQGGSQSGQLRAPLTIGIRLARRRSRPLREPWARSTKLPRRPVVKSRRTSSSPPPTNLPIRDVLHCRGWSIQLHPITRRPGALLLHLLRTPLTMGVTHLHPRKRAISITTGAQIGSLTREHRPYQYSNKAHITKPTTNQHLSGIAVL